MARNPIDVAARQIRCTALWLLVLLCAAPAAWFGLASFVDRAGGIAEGEVVATRESIVMVDDTPRHLFEVVYRYVPDGAAAPQDGSHPVDEALFDRLHVGDRVRIRYSRVAPLRYVAGIGSHLEGAPALSRVRYGRSASSDLIEAGALLAALALAWVAYRVGRVDIGAAAGVIVGILFPGVLLGAAALLIVPLLARASRRQPGHGYGWLLAGAIVLTAAVTYWRVPHPDVDAPGPRVVTTATVRQVRIVDRIWGGADDGPPRDGGQPIGHPYALVDLEFTPVGAASAVHAADRVDADRPPRLSPGSRVSIAYSAARPRSARIAGASRTFAAAAWREMMTLAGAAAVVATTLVLLADAIGARLAPVVGAPGAARR
jgi:hypothetical protein